MGRTLDVLKRAEAGETSQPKETEAPAAVPQLQVVTEEAAAEEMPFIEVGGKGRSVEGSPDVLAVVLQPAAARAPALATRGPLAVAFRPGRSVPVPSPRMAPEVIAYHQPGHEVSKRYQALLSQILPEPA